VFNETKVWRHGSLDMAESGDENLWWNSAKAGLSVEG
jgi:hypothetical protein